MSALRFFYNGIKGSDGKLQKCWYMPSHSTGAIRIYAREYCRFSAEVRAEFVVINNTDTMTDYFEEDCIRVTPNHPLYENVKLAVLAANEKLERRREKRMEARHG